MIFEEKCFSCYFRLTHQISSSGYLYFLRYCAMCFVFVCFRDWDVINFEINFVFLIKPFFTCPKSQDKNLNILRTQRAFKIKQKVFFKIYKALSLKQIKQLFWKVRVQLLGLNIISCYSVVFCNNKLLKKCLFLLSYYRLFIIHINIS